MLQSAYSVNRKELLMTKIIFAMYNPKTDCVEVSLNDEIHVSFNCKNAMLPFVWKSLLILLTLQGLLEKNRDCMPNWLPEMVACKDMLMLWGSLIRGPLNLIKLQNTLVHHYLHLRSYNNYQTLRHLKSIFYLIPLS